MEGAGPFGLIQAKLGVVTGGVVIFLWTARSGRVRLARNCLVFAVGSGVLGFASNLV
jgi:hypothetical protein